MWDFIVNVFTIILVWIYSLVGDFGVAIILFTILIRLATHPLMASQIKSSTAMQQLTQSKEWQNLQKKYENDREKLAAEQMKLYQEKGISPFSSCLPTLIQLPIIFALYQSITKAMAASPLQLLQLNRAISSSIPFTSIQILPTDLTAAIIPIHSQFLWMNLGLPEGLPLPFGIELGFLPHGFPTLAIIVAVTTYLQTKLSTPPAANANDQTAQMNKMMAIYMPLMLGYFALNFASGLAVYFITSNLVGIFQYALLGRIDLKNLLPGKRPAAPKS